MIDNSKEYILCAAIRRLKPKITDNENFPYYKGTNDILNIELGFRHHDIYQRFDGELSLKNKDQGFYTSKGRFVDRYEAAYIAEQAGQCKVLHKNQDENKLVKLNIIVDTSNEQPGEYTNGYSKYYCEYYPLISEELY